MTTFLAGFIGFIIGVFVVHVVLAFFAILERDKTF